MYLEDRTVSIIIRDYQNWHDVIHLSLRYVYSYGIQQVKRDSVV
jgi:hypothetical protein